MKNERIFWMKEKSRRLYKSITKNDCFFNLLRTIQVIFEKIFELHKLLFKF
jgi:hypothetical protein